MVKFTHQRFDRYGRISPIVSSATAGLEEALSGALTGPPISCRILLNARLIKTKSLLSESSQMSGGTATVGGHSRSIFEPSIACFSAA